MHRSALYVTVLFITLSLIIGAWAVQAQSHNVQAADNISLQQLLPVSQQTMGEKQHIIIKHTSTYHTFRSTEQFLQTGQELSRQFGLPEQTTWTQTADHLLYKTEAEQSNGVRMTLLWIGYTDGTSSLMVTAQTEEEASAAAENSRQTMVELQQQLGEKLHGLGVAPQWNVMIQGSLSDSFADTEQGQLSVFRWLTEQLKLQEIGAYHDKGSTSISYYSPDAATNVQVAVHRNSVTKERRITIGMPAISVEY